jgi:DNA-binding MurR/RpiR family transcriptional regulator
MSRSLAITLPMRSEGASNLLRSLLKALQETRAQRARQEIARHAELIQSARRYRITLDARTRERSHG